MTRDEAVRVLESTAWIAQAESGNDVDDAIEMAVNALKKPKGIVNANEFKSAMEHIDKTEDIEKGHIMADELMCDLLASLGYEEGVKIFVNMLKWYS